MAEGAGRAARLAVRAPNHLGELILALPALRRVAEREREAGRPRCLLQVSEWLVPIVEIAGLAVDVVPLPDRRAILRGARSLRAAASGAALDAITLTPSFSSALMLRLAGVRSLRGTAGGGRTLLLTERLDRGPLLDGHRVNEYLAICGLETSDAPEAPRIAGAGFERADAAWRGAVSAAAARGAAEAADRGSAGPIVGLFPGANGPARRWPADRFGRLAARLGRSGATLLVLGGPGDEETTAIVAGAAGNRAFDLGGRTSLLELAGALRSCDLLVTNDTGPMHLAAALGRPVLALEGPADLRQTRPLGSRVRVVGRFDLPCVPCVKNACPRRGAGTVLPDARRECMRLIEVDEVENAAREMLNEEPK